MSDPILSVRNLRVTFPSLAGRIEAVRGVSFDIGNEKVGLIGESGSGKSLTGRSIMRLLPKAAHPVADRMRFDGKEILSLPEGEMRGMRGGEIAMILQDPKFSLNPIMSVGDQIAETCRIHLKLSKREARARTLHLLEQVHINDPARVYPLFPHEVSGGMGQRIMIAMMIVARPSLIIADEPTSALDVSVRGQILRILDELRAERPTGLLFITHDLNLVRRFCDRVLIMYSGRIVEELPASRLDEAEHPYTRGLLDAIPRLDRPRDRLATLQRDPRWITEEAGR
ncbi:ABC transporter ATP-binding protein [Wenxinia saemankumensis]|uniref:Peptide/nickel transport system ATP-binding protein n=1 Tax=Wenxinia saemankumensis TaxID=1447782 RepID=A0A1M6B4H3_9RHOB|nr:ABC transporter ATP-binding protein [Wenxinia saemankumensis]SHI43605.1 peptide/nickel transport system ATP-binding protein [Wenxinia saemankumensis]